MNIVAWVLFIFLVGYVFYAVEETVKEARKPEAKLGHTARISIGLLAVLAAFLLVVDQVGAKNINSPKFHANFHIIAIVGYCPPLQLLTIKVYKFIN